MTIAETSATVLLMTLKQYMAQEGLNLTQLTRLLNRPISTVHTWVEGKRRPGWKSIPGIQKATGGAVMAEDFVPLAKRKKS